MSRAFIAMTVDVEGSITKLPARLDFFLDLFARTDAKATFFVLGEVAGAAPEIVRRIAGAGHEIGFHGCRHVPVSEPGPDEFLSQLKYWRPRLQDLAQQPVEGFRAPYFSICPASEWALDAVSAAGFEYDSSVHPGVSDRYCWRGAPERPVRVAGSGLVEFPVPTLCGLLPIGFSGGGYLRLLPWFLIAWGFRRRERSGAPGMIYTHPWEIEPASRRTPRTRTTDDHPAPWRVQISGRLGRHRMRRRLEVLLESKCGQLAPMGEVISSLAELSDWKPGHEKGKGESTEGAGKS